MINCLMDIPCEDPNCNGCGFEKHEYERRMALLHDVWLKTDTKTGMKYLEIRRAVE